eukprot:SAG11_NODE_1946_length_4019_cov_1.215306_3_plen_189_part_00
MSSFFFNACTTTYSTMDSYRLGPLGWSPAQQSYFSSFLSATNMATTALITTPILARYGNKTVYEGATLVASLAYFLLGQSWRGGTRLQTTLQYTVAKCMLQTPWSEPSRAAIKPMVIKQGISASNGELGRGQISAAYDTSECWLSWHGMAPCDHGSVLCIALLRAALYFLSRCRFDPRAESAPCATPH